MFADINFVGISQTTASRAQPFSSRHDGGGKATQFQLAVDEQFEQLGISLAGAVAGAGRYGTYR
ncbi:hypothetical protein KCP69_01290 [Salmonella enterica subsp. enterica]|nr:hypothetical protein KCP69_01290 [Salmonella enterica subsp. enterica]